MAQFHVISGKKSKLAKVPNSFEENGKKQKKTKYVKWKPYKMVILSIKRLVIRVAKMSKQCRYFSLCSGRDKNG